MKAAMYVLAIMVVIQFGVLIGGIGNFVECTFTDDSEATLVHEVAPQIGVSQH